MLSNEDEASAKAGAFFSIDLQLFVAVITKLDPGLPNFMPHSLRLGKHSINLSRAVKIFQIVRLRFLRDPCFLSGIFLSVPFCL
jgi:hypothetical protein